MSILKSTKTGHKYYSWHHRLDEVIDCIIRLNAPFGKEWREYRYVIPEYNEKMDMYVNEEPWFSFQCDWSHEYFRDKLIERFKLELEKINSKLELEDIPICNPCIQTK